MDALQAIFSRVSTRDFNDKPVPDDKLEVILKAGQSAPVGMGRYDDKLLTVVTDKEWLKAVSRLVPDRNGMDTPFYGAGTVIILSSLLSDAPAIEFADAGAIITTMAIAAEAEEVKSIYLWGFIKVVRSEPELLKKLALPDGYVPVSALAIGYSDAQTPVLTEPRHKIKVSKI